MSHENPTSSESSRPRDQEGHSTDVEGDAPSDPSPDDTEPPVPDRSSSPQPGSLYEADHQDLPVVGIGASADGLQALRTFFEALPDAPGMAFIVIQHLSPDHESSLADILQHETEMTVVQATEDTPLSRDHVYVIPPDRQILVADGRLHLNDLPDGELKRTTIDFFFRSLGEDQQERSVGIILSGTGNDGAGGLQVIKRHGGLTMVQDLEEAGFSEMPRNALNTGIVDIVAPAEELADRLVDFFESDTQYGPLRAPDDIRGDERRALDNILKRVRILTGHELAGYKHPTVLRRIGRRMQILRRESLQDYYRYLESHNEETSKLFSELLIKVTQFFRDPDVWESVRETMIPELFANKSTDEQVRIWVPGCATGEEAYTIGMLMKDYAETLDVTPEIKIFATDLDDDAIETARQGRYPEAIAADVPSDYLKRYFYVDDNGYRISKGLRDQIVFATQNALADPPFSDLDLISCRNLLIYLQQSAQSRLLGLFNYALRPEGYLLLGISESASSEPELFASVDASPHLYRARSSAEPRPLIPGSSFGLDQVQPDDHEPSSAPSERDFGEIHRDVIVEQYAPSSVLVNDNYDLVHVHGETRPYLKVNEGKPTKNLLKMLHDDLRPLLRTLLFQLFQNETSLERNLSFQHRGERHYLRIQGHRVDGRDLDERFAEISFQPIEHDTEEIPPTEQEGEHDEMESIVEELERELEETRERLHATIEEYETSNEELKASNEELLSMNEELQSTTEELETSKEELQSMNEELTTVNEELNNKIEQLNSVNSDLKNLMRSTEIGTIFLDRNFDIKRFTQPVTDYFNFIPSDEGRPFEHVTHSLELESDLLDDARQVLDDLSVVEREARLGDDRYFLIRLLPYRTVDDHIDGVVMTFIEITERKRAQQQLETSERKFRTVFETAADAMFVYELDDEGRPGPFMEVNGEAVNLTGVERRNLHGWTIEDLFERSDSDVTSHLDELQTSGCVTQQAKLTFSDDDRDHVPVEIHSNCTDVIGDRRIVVENIRDVTERKRYEEKILEAKHQAEELAELRSVFLSTLSHDVRSPLMAINATLHVLKRQADDEMRESIERIEQATHQLEETLDSILEMTRLEADETIATAERFDLSQKIFEVMDLHEEWALERGLELTSDLPSGPLEVELDPSFTTRILNNLVDNALKYTDEGGVEVQLEADEATVWIEVEDTGYGISQEERDSIFERFETGRSADDTEEGGVGLGLAITKLLIESMEGRLSLESTEGEGSTFTIELPRRLEDVRDTLEAD